MEKEKPIDKVNDADKAASADDQLIAKRGDLIANEEFAKKDQAVPDKQPITDKESVAHRQSEIDIVPSKSADQVIGEAWAELAKPGVSESIQSVKMDKQPSSALNDKEPKVGDVTAVDEQAQLIKNAADLSIKQGRDPAAFDMAPAPDIPRDRKSIDAADRESVSDKSGGPGTYIFGPGGAIDNLMDPRYELRRVAIALGGGGSVGDFELGALDFIHNRFLGSSEGAAMGFERKRFDIATGTSVGAVNAGAIAQGAVGSMGQLKKIWFKLTTTEDFYLLNPVFSDFIGKQDDSFFTKFGRILNQVVYNGDEYSRLVAQKSIMDPQPLRRLCWNIEQHWSPSGPGLRGAGVSVARDVAGHRVVFVRGYDDMLYAKWQLDSDPVSAATLWSEWKSLGQLISSDPVAYTTSFLDPYGREHPDNPLRVGVVARTENEQGYGGRILNFDDVTHISPVGPANPDRFRAWEDIPPTPNFDRPFSSQPTIIQRAMDGRAWAFCRDEHSTADPSRPSHRSHFNRWDGRSWGEWTPFGQDSVDIASNITGCSFSDGALELFAHTVGGLILRSFAANDSTPGDWTSPGPGHTYWPHGVYSGAGATSDLLVLVTEDPGYSLLDVFWRGIDGQVWTRRRMGTESRWQLPRNLGGMITSNLCSGRNSEGVHTIFTRGLDDKLYELRQTSRFGEWPQNSWNRVGIGAPPGLTLVADPYTLRRTRVSRAHLEETEVYAVASDHSLWAIRQQRDGTYTSWIPLGGKIWTGTNLRMCVVALEDGEVRYVEEGGRFLDSAGRFIATSDGGVEPILTVEGQINFARSEGAMASCSAPAVFPAIHLNGKSWVDGGIRYGVPIGAAIVAGASSVIAIATVPRGISAVPPLLARTLAEPWPSLENFILTSVGQPLEHLKIRDYSQATMIDVLTRSFVELLVDATSWSELEPPTPWEVPVSVIQQTFKIHEGGTIDPGLIHINYSYGWMRAFDVLMTSPEERSAANDSTDRIIQARWDAWKAEMAFREAYLVATRHDASVRASMATGHAGNDWGFDQTREAAELARRWLQTSRDSKKELARALAERSATLHLPLDPESPEWLSQFELFAFPAHWTTAWKNEFQSSLGWRGRRLAS